MSDWAKKLTDKRKDEIKQHQIEREKDLSDRRMLEHHSDGKWVEVRHAAEKCADEISSGMGDRTYMQCRGASDHHQFVFKLGTAQFPISYDHKTWRISASAMTYILSVVPGNGVEWKTQSGEIVTSEEIAQMEAERAFNSVVVR